MTKTPKPTASTHAKIFGYEGTLNLPRKPEGTPLMDGFVINYQHLHRGKDDKHYTMHYFDPDSVPITSGLGLHFAVSDAWFAAAPNEAKEREMEMVQVMIQSRRPVCRDAGLHLVSALLFLALNLGLGAPALAQAPPANCPHVCTGTYALCIAASCNPETGQCGVKSDGTPCDQEGLDAGTCGPCYIFQGKSCSVFEPCEDLEGGLYSTYSEKLLDDFGFKWSTVANDFLLMNCMDMKCIPTNQTVTLNGQKGIPTATCGCTAWCPPVNVYLQVKSCSKPPSTGIWSTAPPLMAGASCDF